MAVIGLLEEAPALGIGRIVISGAEEAESVTVGSVAPPFEIEAL